MGKRSYPSARERILDAAEQLIVERGGGQITVDAVLAATGLSKGGFFHHFASKDALLEALMARLIARTEAWLAQAAEADPEPRGARLRAQIALAFDAEALEARAPRALLLTIIDAAFKQPELRGQAQQMNAASFARDTAEGIPPGNAIAIQFTLDGFWLSEAIGTATLTAEQRQGLRDTLMALARPKPSPASSPEHRSSADARASRPSTRARSSQTNRKGRGS
ncbi:TetR/AcrR family transcriptional regulator [Haliangium ochraceum]|uniref:Transcriptional regulator, TetR family n=1 Tax=Haliangium ochraceum (strain DSM 14365 / JCM 11303 / SMP-2) TaxID=502025 RepID=D0LZN7_HALO1|nr:TetR/AcrR family transcriptional regulator [Haliangium ochraceum]ACY18016.1 transcriptional regulator, TetR family [Haliangium ochraceum DSM 14365]